MAARLKLANNRAGRIFRSLYKLDKGSFENDVDLALKDWLLFSLWNSLNKDTLTAFKRKVSKIAKKCWPKDLQMDGNLTWLFHNHRVFSGNVPMWADWRWPQGSGENVFKEHFFCLLIGQHPAGGPEARCSNLLCKDKLSGTIYDHHFFECAEYCRNRGFFREGVWRMYDEHVEAGHHDISRDLVDAVLEKPCGMWVGLFDSDLFGLGLKLGTAHELHRIVTVASVLSWGRFYPLP